MKVLFHSLEALVGELRDRQVRIVRIAPAVEESENAEAGGIPALISRVLVTATLTEHLWVEWRYRVGRDVAEVVERGLVLSARLRRRSDEALAVVARYVDREGFEIREGIVTHDTATIDTFELPDVSTPCRPAARLGAPGGRA
jgi:hypothetical protein